MRRVAHIPALVAQHAGDAAFLWHRRRLEIDGPRFGEADVGRLDLRLDAHCDGLVAAGQGGWDAALAQFGDFNEAGEVFVLGMLALRHSSPELMESALGAAATVADGDGWRALSGAVARADAAQLRPFVPDWLDAADASWRRLGLAALAHRRVDAGSRWGRLLADADPAVRAKALRLVGLLRRRERLVEVEAATSAETPVERLAAARSLALLGETGHNTLEALDGLLSVSGPGTVAEQALELRLLCTPGAQRRTWLRRYLLEPRLDVVATRATGLLGDPALVPWLVERLRDPRYATAASLALRDLYAVDFDDTELFSAEPDVLGPAFEDWEDGAVAVADRVEGWWEEGCPSLSAPFQSLRRQRLDALRRAIGKGEPLADWRRTRRASLWS